jgi:NADP-dependent 3-hydroxy acid dehydrogenase YdfG
MSEMKIPVLLITGASSGIGAETARQAVEAGYHVALCARSKDKLDALVDELGSDRAFAQTCDVTDFGDQERMVAGVMNHYGRIDAVFANAGVGGRPAGFASGSIDDWQEMVHVNILGAAYTLRATLDEVKKNKGHVVITGSVAGRRTLAGSMYSATKWAVSAIGYGLRAELEGSGVRVTIIEPGMVDTPFFDKPVPDALKAEDVARTVLFALNQPKHVDVHELMVLPTPPEDH